MHDENGNAATPEAPIVQGYLTDDGERIPPIEGDPPCDEYDPAGPGAGVEADGQPQCAACGHPKSAHAPAKAAPPRPNFDLLKHLHEVASKGPWVLSGGQGVSILAGPVKIRQEAGAPLAQRQANADFIVEAYTAMPGLIAFAEHLEVYAADIAGQAADHIADYETQLAEARAEVAALERKLATADALYAAGQAKDAPLIEQRDAADRAAAEARKALRKAEDERDDARASCGSFHLLADERYALLLKRADEIDALQEENEAALKEIERLRRALNSAGLEPVDPADFLTGDLFAKEG